jgi:type II secretory pathway component PulF
MPTFAYQARDKEGQRVNGMREAQNRDAVLEILRSEGLFVTKLAPVGEFKSVAPVVTPVNVTAPPAESKSPPATPSVREMPSREMPVRETPQREMPVRERAPQEAPFPSAHYPTPSPQLEVEVPKTPEGLGKPLPAVPPTPTQALLTADAKQMSLYFRQMHAMIHAGTSVAHALNLMAENAPNGALRKASAEMAVRTQRGEEWNRAMTAYPGLFSELMVGMIAAGEGGGFLERILLRLSQYSERDYEIQQTVKRETWYPKLLLACSFLIPSVVPLVLHGPGAWFNSIKGVLFFALMLFIGWIAFKKLAPGTLSRGPQRLTIDEFKLRFPYAGKFVRALAAAKFCRALGALQGAGMGLHRTINLASDACGNEAMARQTRKIIHRLDKGESLTSSLTATGQFPALALQMLATGEASGSVEAQLDKVADFLEADAETAIKKSVQVLGVAVFLLVAILVGMQVIGGYTQHFNNIENTAREFSN